MEPIKMISLDTIQECQTKLGEAMDKLSEAETCVMDMDSREAWNKVLEVQAKLAELMTGTTKLLGIL